MPSGGQQKVLSELSLTLESSAPVYVVDDGQRIVHMNRSARELLGIPAEESPAGAYCYAVIGGVRPDGRVLCAPSCPVVRSARKGDVPDTERMLVQRPPADGVDGDPLFCEVEHLILRLPLEGPRTLVLHLLRDLREAAAVREFADEVLAATHRFVAGYPPAVQHLLERLTPRERAVMELLVGGANTDDIAERLTLTRSTVRNHVGNILRKLGCHSRVEAVALVAPYVQSHVMQARPVDLRDDELA